MQLRALTSDLDPKPTQTPPPQWSASTELGHNTAAPSQHVHEDIELGATLQPKRPARPANTARSFQDDYAPLRPDHIRWAPEDIARRKYHRAVRQEQRDECFAEQSTSTRPTRRQNQELKARAAHKECPEWSDQDTAPGLTWQSDGHDEAALATPDCYGTSSGMGKDSAVLSREVSESFEILYPRRHSQSSCQTDEHVEMLPWLSRQVTIGRNSNFHGLTAKDREELGGVEYRSLKVLFRILIGKVSK